MDLDTLLRTLAATPDALEALIRPHGSDLLRRRPDNGGWSIVEILAHLLDEERFDFRPRVLATLRDPTEEWTPIDPENWVRERGYNERDVAQTLEEFRTERAASLELLRNWNSPDWNLQYDHPQFGALRAGDLMLSWTVHDTLHLRQITHRLYDNACRTAAQFSGSYAGSW